MDLQITPQVTPEAVFLRCTGRLVAGPEVQAFETALGHKSLDRYVMILNLKHITRLDSIGLGALVRSTISLDHQGKSLRLAAVPPILMNLIQLTRLHQVLHLYATEDDALHAAAPSILSPSRNPEARILFYDSSPHLCALVSSVLGQAGFEVHTACSLHEAHTLLQARRIGRVLLGPGTPHVPSTEAAKRLRSLAPHATFLHLEPGFRTRDAEEATRTLLEMFAPASHIETGPS